MTDKGKTKKPVLRKFEAFNVVKQVTPENRQDYSTDILIWPSKGLNNDYPQYFLKLVDNSPTATALLETRQQYIQGDGISLEEVAEMQVNPKMTADDLLSDITKDFSRLDGYCILVNFKPDVERGFVVKKIDTLPFEACRLGIDKEGYVNGVVYNPYFGTKDYDTEHDRKYHLFTDKVEDVAKDIKAENYKGHVLWFGWQKPGHRFYPFPSLGSAIDWIGADGEIQNFHYNNISSGFMLKVLMTVFGDPDLAVETRENKDGEVETVKTAAKALNEMLDQTFGGTDGKQVLVNWVQDKDNAPQIAPFTTETYDNIYNELQGLITEQLTRTVGIPQSLANIDSSASFNVSGDLLINAVYTMHNNIRRFQAKIENDLKQIFKMLPETPSDEWTIKNFFPFPDNRHLDKAWELMSSDEKKKWLNENTNFEFKIETFDDAN